MSARSWLGVLMWSLATGAVAFAGVGGPGQGAVPGDREAVPLLTNDFEGGLTKWSVKGAEVSGEGAVLWGADNIALVREPGRGKCLRVSANAALASPFIRYRGEKLEVSGLARLNAVKRGKNPWNKAAIVVSVFDENRQALKIHWGHWVVMLEDGTKPWLPYVRRLALPPQVKWVRVWVGLWNTSAGTAYFDDVRIRLLPRDWRPPDITLTVDTTSPGPPIRRFWDGVDAGHCERIRHPAYQKALDMLPRLGFRWVRVHTPLTCIKYDDRGNPVDFSFLDELLRSVVRCGLRVYFTVEPMPDPLASKPRRGWCNISPPKDYAAWRRLCCQVVEHLEQAFGRSQVRSWHFAVWNEPFASGYFDGTADDYLRVYDYAVAGVLDADAKLTVGGLDGGAPDPLTEKFLRHITAGKSLAGSAAPLRCDFLSVHLYAGTGYAEPFPMLRRNIFGLKWAVAQMKSTGFAGPLQVTEWGCSSSGRPWTDDAYNAAFTVRSIHRLLDLGIPDRLYYFSLVDHIYREEKMYVGGLGMLTPAGAPKPVVAAFEALAQLNGRRLPVSGGDQFTDALAVRRDDGSLAVLIWNHCDDPLEEMLPRRCRLKLHSLPSAHYELFMIDSRYSNAIDDWRAAGSPQQPPADLLRKLDEAGRLQKVARGRLSSSTVTVTLPVPSVALIVLEP